MVNTQDYIPQWTRLVRFSPVDSTAVLLGEPVDPAVDVGAVMAQGGKVEVCILEGDLPWTAGKRTGETKQIGKLHTPVPPEMCGPIRCLGLSYRDHAAELGLTLPAQPALFLLPPSTLTPALSPISVPAIAQNDELDWEVELAFVLGRTCRDVSEEEAMGCILGWTVANDLTARKVQAKDSQWSFCKGFDTFLPLGPVLVSPRALPDPSVLALRTEVNGKCMQDGKASEMIFSIPQILAHISRGTTLPAGTVIITGTPPGIGESKKPKMWLKDGDEVRCWISHGIGTLSNRVVYE